MYLAPKAELLVIVHDHGTIVHVDVLPGTVDDYLEAAARVTAASF